MPDEPGQPAAAPQAPPDWRSSVPEDLRKEAFVAEAKDLPSFVKQAVDAHKAFGSRAPLPIGERATPEAIEEFKKKAAPATPDAYGIKWNEEIEWAPEAKDKWTKVFQKHGVMPWQAQGIMDDAAEEIKREATVAKTAQDEARYARLAKLKETFGDQVDMAQTKASKALKHLGKQDNLGELVKGKLTDAGLHEDPDVLRFLTLLHDQVTEDSWMQGETQTMLTPENARQKAEAMYALPKDHPFKNRAHPRHKEACAEHEQLMMIANGLG